jgi:5-methylcytosine-specific restriction endonuclease McrA
MTYYIQQAIDKQRPKHKRGHCLWCDARLTGQQRTFCCLEHYWLNFNKYNWAKIRERIVKRDNNECKAPNCHNIENLSVHHIIKVTERPDLVMDDSNLITLCRKHHEEAEAYDLKQQRINDFLTPPEISFTVLIKKC